MTLKPGPKNLYIRRGDIWEVTVGPSLLNGVAEVIPDVADVLAQVRATTDLDAPLIVDLAVHAALSAGDTVCTLSLTAAETAALETGTEFVWDFQPDPTGETWISGTVEIEGDVSRVIV